MTLNYVGNRAFKTRLAEFEYSEKEEKRFMKIAGFMKKEGWNIDTGVEGWAAIEVEDREQFNEVMADFKKAKKLIK